MSDQGYGFRFHGRGPVCAVQAFATKSGKDIITVVIKLEGKWEQYIPIKCFGALAEEASVLKPGQVVSVKGRLGGRGRGCAGSSGPCWSSSGARGRTSGASTDARCRP